MASASKKPDVPWAPELTMEDRPIMASESANDINVGVALSTALLLPKDLERNAELSELVDMKREPSSMKKEIKSLESRMRKLEDQAEAATKAQQMAEEKVESAEAIRKVAEAEKKEAEVKKAQAEKELQQALATKEAEVKEADEKAYAQGMTDVTEDYKLQVRQVEDESETEADAEDEDEGKNDDEALVRKPKDAAEAKSPPSAEQVMDLTLDEEGDEVGEAPKEIAIGELLPDLLLAERNLDNTLAEIDAEIEAEKVAEEVPPESSEVPVPAAANTEES
ncbi:methyl-CpG-binding domain-containing protein 10-like [Camellia sinensis]|uniref:methyl-CpG-binding domain-containing protein 10-like n=1 Tax=Camellia sinensis TaxID=4442 RepID=UPI001035EB9C|nr:methyl-CpG-binding domain-containing protein 10-like [Camellia sinensis]